MTDDRVAINTFDQLVRAGGGIAIVYRARDRGAAWQVMRIVNGKQVATDKSEAWYNYGKKTFNVSFGKSRAEVLEEAKQWIAEHFGEHGPWKRNRMGDYVLEAVNKKYPLRRKT